MTDEEKKILEDKIGVSITNADLFHNALTHRSYVNEAKNETLTHNERLEFLGDAVLELVVTDYLYKQFPNDPEGVLTAYRSALVNTEALSVVGKKLTLDEHLLLSKGESAGSDRAKNSIIADTVEAVIGALYLDSGYESAKTFVALHMLTRIDEIRKEGTWIDRKSKLQELAQAHLSITPEYRLLSAEGPDHDKIFTMGVYFGGALVAKGSGNSKQDAEQQAAEHAMEQNGWTLTS